jgi:hypothetical protein
MGMLSLEKARERRLQIKWTFEVQLSTYRGYPAPPNTAVGSMATPCRDRVRGFTY